MLVEREQHVARARVETTLDYHCAHCGFRGHADVDAAGWGAVGAVGLSGWGLHGGAEMASDAASASAWAQAFAAVDLAACPRCDRRQPGALRRHLRGCLGRALAVASAVGVVVAFAMLPSDHPALTILLAGSAVGAVTGTLDLYLRARRAIHASYVVHWHRE